MPRLTAARTLKTTALLALLALALAACSLASEPVPAGPIETGPMPGQATAPGVSLDVPDLGGEEDAPVGDEPPAEELPAEEEPAAEEPEEPEGAGDEPAGEEPAGEAPPTEPGVGVVEGQVQMGTPGESLPAGLEVSLRGVAVSEENEVYEFLARSAPVDPGGAYRFDDVPLDVERAAYVVEVVYDGVSFENGALIDPENPVMELPLEVYASTTDESVVSVDAMHIIFEEHPGALLVTQLYVFSNASDRIYVTDEPVLGGRRGSVAISVPEGAYGLQFDEGQVGGRYVAASETTYYDTQRLQPGAQSLAVIVNYFLPYEGSGEYEFPVRYDTRQATILAQEGHRVRAGLLNEAGSQTIDGIPYAMYSGQNFAAGDTLTVEVRAGGAATSALPVVLAVAAGVLLAAGVGYWLLQRNAAPLLAVEGLSARQEGIIAEIAALDEAHEAGRVNRFEYEARRAALKAELAAEVAER